MEEEFSDSNDLDLEDIETLADVESSAGISPETVIKELIQLKDMAMVVLTAVQDSDMEVRDRLMAIESVRKCIGLLLDGLSRERTLLIREKALKMEKEKNSGDGIEEIMGLFKKQLSTDDGVIQLRMSFGVKPVKTLLVAKDNSSRNN